MCLQSAHSLVLIQARPVPVKIPNTSCVQDGKQYFFSFSIVRIMAGIVTGLMLP